MKIIVENSKIGSGFNLSERENPPPIGSTITYKYRGLTNSGKPRFATYWREKIRAVKNIAIFDRSLCLITQL